MDVNKKVELSERLGEAAERIEMARGYPALGPLLAVVEGLHTVVTELVDAVPVDVVEPATAEGAVA